ncbi:hypothetical protein JCM5350_006996 [Sporobolomyces pararoseus]
MAELPSDASARSHIKNIQKLKEDGSNWAIWKSKMEVVFDAGGVETLLEEEGSKEPTDPVEKKIWNKKWLRFRGYLMDTMEDEPYRQIAESKPLDGWEALKRKFAYSDILVNIATLTSLQTLSASTSADVAKFVQDHRQVLASAKQSNFVLVQTSSLTDTEERKQEVKNLNMLYSWHILCGLPEEPTWQMFRTLYKTNKLSTWDPRTLLDEIQDQLRTQNVETKSYNPALPSSHSSPSTETALSSTSSKQQQKKEECKFCHQKNPNHSHNKCWKNPRNPNNRLNDKGQKSGGGNSGGGSRPGGGNNRGGSSSGGGVHVTLGEGAECALSTSSKQNLGGWYFDSGASTSITNDIRSLSNVVEHREVISVAEGGTMESVGKGKLTLESKIDGVIKTITIADVLLVPKSRYNLLSLPQLSRYGTKSTFFPDESFAVWKDKEKILVGSSKEDGICKIKLERVKVVGLALTEDQRRRAVIELHRKMGHPGKGVMRDLLKLGHLSGCTTTDIENFFKNICPPCIQGKSTAAPFPSSPPSTTAPFAKLHSDIAGPLSKPSFGGARYIIFLLDEGTGIIQAESMKDRTEVLDKFSKMLLKMKQNLSSLENEFPTTTILQTDNGTEYLSKDFQSFLLQNNILHQTSIPHTPQQNGKSERTVRTIKEKIRTLLFDSKLPQPYWAEALNFAVYLLNRLPSSSLNGESPYFRIHKKIDPSLQTIPNFGQRVWAHVDNSDSLGTKGQEFRFLGVGNYNGKKAIKVQLVDAIGGNGVRWVRDKEVKFSKEEAQSLENIENNDDDDEEEELEEKHFEEIDNNIKEAAEGTKGGGRSRLEEFKEEQLAAKWGAKEGEKRVPKPKTLLSTQLALLTSSEKEVIDESEDVGLLVRRAPTDTKDRPPPTIPSSPEEAITSLYADEWSKAMEDEINGLKLQDAWKLVEKEIGKNVLGCRWHYTIKQDTDGNPKAFKARLVVQGYKKIPWLSQFGPSSAPLVTIEIVFLFYVLVAHYTLYTAAVDLVKGYLAAPADLISSIPILMKQPPLFTDPEKPDHVCQLKKALYGLPQSGRAFYHKVKSFVNELHLVSVSDDVSLYYGIRKGHIFLFLSYSDDGLIASSKLIVEEFLQSYKDEFDLSVRGGLDGATFLGREISYDQKNGLVMVSCSKAINKLFQVVGNVSSRDYHSPIQKGINYSKHQGEPIRKEDYLKIVGHLQWIVPIRFDIAYAVNIAARYSSNPGKEHWALLRRIIGYLQTTQGVKRKVGGSLEKKEGLVAYVDADFAGDVETRRSTTGGVITFMGSPIAHLCRRQTLVTLSTLQAEGVALTSTLAQLEWLNSIITSLPIPNDSPITIYCDNRALVTNLNSETYFERNKNVDIKIKYVQEQILAGFIKVEWISTEENLADLFTKALPPTRHRELSEKLGLIGFDDSKRWGSR